MPTRSFTLRQGVGLSGGGTDGAQLRNTGDDSMLRANNFASLPSDPINAYFHAAPLSYTSVDLDWNIESSVTWLRLVVVGSTTGHPVTILDGRTVVTVEAGTDLFSYVDKDLTPGVWHYYTLFAQLDDGINIYYTALKHADTLLPVNHGSTRYLFNRIPEYYRIADAELGAGQEGPLYRFVELIGYEMDYARTLIDTLRDVRKVRTLPVQALQTLGNMLGVGAEAEGISESRYRYLLANIMHLRLRKGTLSGIRGYISAISGYQADIQTVSATRIDISIYAQRVNLVKNPKFAGTTLWTVVNGGATITTPSNVLTVTNGTGSTTTTTVTTNVFPAVPGKNYGVGLRLDELPAGATITTDILWYDGSGTTTENVGYRQPVQTGTTQQRLTTDAPVAPGGTISATVRFTILTPAGQAVKLTRVIVEPGPVGEYFDGDTQTGGYLPGSTGQFDFRWDSSIDGSYSYYNLDFGVTQDVIMNAMPHIIPVNVTVGGISGYAITEWSYFPGK